MTPNHHAWPPPLLSDLERASLYQWNNIERACLGDRVCILRDKNRIVERVFGKEIEMRRTKNAYGDVDGA